MKKLFPLALVFAGMTALACNYGASDASPSGETGNAGQAAAEQPADGTVLGGPGETVSLDIASFSFGDPITVRVGTTVRWTNGDGASHTITVTSGGEDDSGNLSQGSTFEMTFNEPGIVEYMCTIHPNMRSAIRLGSV